MENNNREKIAIVPIAQWPEHWDSELHAGYVHMYANGGYVKISRPEELRTAGDRVFLFPERVYGHTGVKGKSQYQVLCELCNEAHELGYRLEFAFVGD